MADSAWPMGGPILPDANIPVSEVMVSGFQSNYSVLQPILYIDSNIYI